MHDPFDLYERAVQAPARLAPLLVALHGAGPTRLREDFGGTGALARAFVRESPDRSALVVDIDPAPLARCAGHPNLRTLVADATRLDDADPADIIFVGNFSLGYVECRRQLARYLEACRRRLAPGACLARRLPLRHERHQGAGDGPRGG